MTSYPLPENESQRLAILKALEVLDTPLEERYERITRLLAKALSVEGAAISFVDRDRVWFKSITGADLTETPRDVSFCSHAICHDGLFVVEDASADPRFADNPLVTRPRGQRFYAAQALSVGGGLNVGAVCVFDSRQRTLGADDLQFLRDMADTVIRELRASILR
jgi:GAF domain-containing protein